MKFIIVLTVFIAFVYSIEAYKYKLDLKIGVPYTYSIVGNIDVSISGSKKTEKIVFDKTTLKFQQNLIKSIDFPEEEIQQVVVTWHSNNQEVLQVHSLTARKAGSKSQEFTTVYGGYYLLNGDSIELTKL